jgi:TRAP-type C4-dicarboxylate transport system substrate-binding protein
MSISSKLFNTLTPVQQQKVKAAAMAAAKYNNENNIKDESSLREFFKSKGLKVVIPNVAEFRKTVQEKYLSSEAAANWPKGLLQRINDVK